MAPDRNPGVPALRAVVAALLTGLGSVGFAVGGQVTACGTRSGCRRLALPAPVTIVAGAASRSVGYQIGRDGRIRRVGAPASRIPHGAAVFAATGTWFMSQRGHLVVGRGRQALWRSRAALGSTSRVGVIMAGSRAVTFQHDHKLYIASRHGIARPVASREAPLGWTALGLYTYRYQGRELLLRTATGRLVKVLARGPFEVDPFAADGSAYFAAHGYVMRADGIRVRRLASLRSLGFSPRATSVQPLGRFLQLEDNSDLFVLRSSGSLFARTLLPRAAGRLETISSGLTVAPSASTVAFTAAAGSRRGTETVYLLRAGSDRATPIYREHVKFAVCERGADLQWHLGWLLYSNSEGNAAVIDTAGTHRAIDLTDRIKALPGARRGYGAYWSGEQAVR